MKNRYILVSVFAVAFSSFTAAAQNLDPTVEVSRAYEGKLMEINKPVRDVNVPDSVGTFRLDFDYSVFENPYRGAYEFKPYLMSMRPVSDNYKPGTFYLKAGAGYRLYPELDLIWSPLMKNGFSMNVYASHESYVGDYRKIMLDGEAGNARSLVRSGKESWDGYDLMSKAGVNGKYDWKAGTFGFNVDYFGLAGRAFSPVLGGLRDRCYDAVDANLSLASNKGEDAAFFYGVNLNYSFAEDKLNLAAANYLMEHIGSLDAFFGFTLKNGHKLLFDLGGQMAAYRNGLDGYMGKCFLAPRYAFRKGRWFVDAGVKVDVGLSLKSQQYVYPDVKVSLNAIKDAMDIYVSVTGGTHMNTYASVLSENHYVDFTYDAGFLSFDVERVKAQLGFKGRISKRFSYDLRGGYSLPSAMLTPGVSVVGDRLLPVFGYASYQKAFAALDWRLDTDSFKFDGTVAYTHSWGFSNSDWLFAPAAVTGNAAFEYNWKRRVFVGVECDFSTGRKMASVPAAVASSVVLPGYADLGVSLEYALNRKLSFWLKGGNLCCMTIQRTPLYAEGGISATAGICLNL